MRVHVDAHAHARVREPQVCCVQIKASYQNGQNRGKRALYDVNATTRIREHFTRAYIYTVDRANLLETQAVGRCTSINTVSRVTVDGHPLPTLKYVPDS